MDWYAPIARHLVIPLYAALKGGTHGQSYARRIAAWEFLSADEIAERQWRKLERLLKHAYENVPYYRRVFDERGLRPRDIKDFDDLRKLPILTKQDIRNHLPDLTARNIPGSELVDAFTGGTTGIPMHFKRDRRCRDMHWASHAAFARWYGWRPGDPYAVVWGAPQDFARPSWRYRAAAYAMRRPLVLNAFRLADNDVKRFVLRLRRLRPTLLRGYTEAIRYVAEWAADHGVDLKVPAIACTAEPLYDHQRKSIQALLGGEVFNEYGSRELGLIATECRRHRGLHVNMFTLRLEVLTEGGAPASPGEVGTLVATDLEAYGMPLIRYDTGDVAAWARHPCPCGLQHPLLAGLAGRQSALLVTASGTVVSGHALDHCVDVPAQLQYVQSEDLSMEVRALPRNGFGPEHEAAIRDAVRTLLGDNVPVTVQKVAAIPRAPSGKYLFCESRAALVESAGTSAAREPRK